MHNKKGIHHKPLILPLKHTDTKRRTQASLCSHYKHITYRCFKGILPSSEKTLKTTIYYMLIVTS